MKTKILFIIISCFFFLNSNAQCAMCRAVLENEEGQSQQPSRPDTNSTKGELSGPSGVLIE